MNIDTMKYVRKIRGVKSEGNSSCDYDISVQINKVKSAYK